MPTHAHAPPDPAAIARLRGLISSTTAAGDQGAGWDAAWQQSLTPWDRRLGPQPVLIAALTAGSAVDALVPREGRALVAGCGRGYDAELLAKRGLETVGVDISATAVQRADEWLASLPPHEAHSRLRFVQADFFKLGSEDGPQGKLDIAAGGWHVAYDYTFFCALPPAYHEQWAASYKRNIRPGGVLVTLVYPIQGDREGGPPYSVSPARYSALLADSFDLVHDDPAPPGQTEERKGIEALMVWRRRARE